MVESLRRVTGKLSINSFLHCLTLTKGPIDMIEEKTLLPNLEDTRRDLIALRVKHGADSAIGHHCSNVIELIQNHHDSEPGTNKLRLRNLVGRQMEDLRRLLA